MKTTLGNAQSFALRLCLGLSTAVAAAYGQPYDEISGALGGTGLPAARASSAGRSIYVLDTGNRRVETFGPGGAYSDQFTHRFDVPSGITMDSSGNIYVKDGSTHCTVDKFDKAGRFLLKFGACFSGALGPGILDNSGAVTTDPSGNVWVTSPNYYYVQEFDGNGNYLNMVCFANLGIAGCPAATPFAVQPQGIASDAGGNLYVTNVYPLSGGSNVVELSNRGVYLASFGGPGAGDGQFNAPWGIAIDRRGDMYVADSQNNRIQKFDSAGAYLSQFGSAGSGNGQFNCPVAIAFDSGGNVYVADVGNNRVQEFDGRGGYLGQFGSPGTGNGQFIAPFGIVTK